MPDIDQHLQVMSLAQSREFSLVQNIVPFYIRSGIFHEKLNVRKQFTHFIEIFK